MQLHKHLLKSVFGKTALLAATLCGVFLFGGTLSARAADRDDCERRVARTEHRLHEAIEDHGYYSRQANHWRHERHEAYERCYGRDYRYRDYRGYDRDRY